MQKYRNWKVKLVLLMKDKVLSDTNIDLINTVEDVNRIFVNKEGYSSVAKGTAAYDITGTSSGKKYIIRIYTYLSTVTRIGELLYDNTTQPGLENIIGYEIDLDPNETIGFKLTNRFPDTEDEDVVTPTEFCREADYKIRLTDAFGNPLCARIGSLPTITLTPGPSIIYRGSVWTEPGYSASDIEDGDLTSHVLVESNLDVNTLGTYVIKYTVTDTDSQTVSTTRTINVVVPDVAPVITLLPSTSGSISPINIIEGDEFIDPGVLAVDPEDGDISNQVIVTGNVPTNVVGTYILTYTVTDSGGNVVNMDRVVNVLANTMPTITLLPGDGGIASPITIPAGHTFTEPGYTASDSEDGDLTGSVVIGGDTVDTSVEGNYTLSYSVTDNNGGTTVVHRTVTIISNNLPTITLLPDSRGDIAVVVLQLGQTWVDPGYTASDIEDGDISNQVSIVGEVNNDLLGENILTYSVTDNAGNQVTATRTVRVIDPVLTLVLNEDENHRDSPMYVLETGDSGTIVDPGAVATSTVSGVTTDISNSIVAVPTIPTNFLAGMTGTITYTVTDQYGMNSISVVRIVKAVANPVITLLAPIGQVATPMVAIEDTGLVVPGATATDYLLHDISSDIVVSGDTVDTTTPGTYNVIYTVTDALGLTATKTRVVNILANNEPSITLTPTQSGETSPVNIAYGDEYIEPGATAYDPEDGDISNQVVISGTVDANTSGTYTITYSIVDSSNATVTATRTVVVALNSGPEITLTGGSPYEIVEGTVWSEPGYVALDAEQGNITASVVISGDTVDTNVIGTYNVLYTVIDNGGLTATKTRVVNVIANNVPTITLVGGETFKRLQGPNWVEPGYTAYDSEDGNITAGVVVTGVVDPATIGQYSLTYSVTDSSGVNTTVTRQIVILSNSDLAIAMRNPPVGPPASPMEWNLGEAWVDPGADVYNPEGEAVNQYLQTTGTVDPSTIGSYQVTYSATDSLGRSATATRTVNVVLVNLAPTITLNGINPMEWIQGTPWVEPGYAAYDIEDGDITANVVVTGDDFDVNGIGNHEITYTVTDSGGKSGEVIRTVSIIAPNVAPVITLNGGNVSIPNGTLWDDPGFSAMDANDGDITASVVIGGDTVDTNVNGNYVITYDVTDSGGLTDHKERLVTVTPDLAPTITLVGGTQTILINTSYNEPGYSAYDADDGDLTGSVYVDDSALDITTAGIYQLVYTVTDSAGHTVTKYRDVKVLATDTPPTLTLFGGTPYHTPQHGNYYDPGYYASDALDGNITSDVVITGDTVDTLTVGTYNVVYTVTDSGGNSASETREVVVDFVNKPPVLTLINGNNVYYPNGLAWVDPGFIAEDYEDGTITSSVIIGGDMVDTSTDGEYNVVYTVTDSNGATVSKSRTVHVVPNTPPNISLAEHPDNPGDAYNVTLVQGHIWVDPGYTAADAQQGVITDQVVVGGDTVDPDVPGTYNITYTVTDNMGISTTVTRAVTYTVNNIPVINLTPWVGQNDAYHVTLPWGTPWIEPGYTGTDSEDGIITDDVVLSGDNPPNTTTAGTYVITYTVTDSYGNTGTKDRTVIVLQNQSPSITLHNPPAGHGSATNMWVYTNHIWSEPGYSASDAEDGDLTGSVVIGGDAVITDIPNTYTVTYTVTDSFGNSNTIARHVEVKDNTAPTIMLLGDNPQYILEGSSNAIDPGATAYDEEDGDVTSSITSDAYPDTSIVATTNISYSAMDSQGLIGYATREVIVTPNVPLVITVTGDNPYEIEADGNAYTDPGHSCITPDGIDITNDVVVNSSAVDTSTIGTYTVNYSVTDYVGRTGSATRTVNVVQVNHPPVITITDPTYKIPVNGTYVEPGATSLDAIDGDLTAGIVIDTSNVDTTTAGTYSVTYTSTDSGGLSVTATRSLEVYVNSPPTVTLLGDNPVTLTVGGTYTDAGATAVDADQGDLTASIVVSGDTVDVNTVGDYNVNYTVTDEGGLGDSKTRTVHVVPDEPTVITLTGGTPYYVEVNTSYTEPGYTAMDQEDGDITASVVISGDTVDVTTVGDYTINYNVTDSYGNVTSIDRVVSVVNPPTVTLTADSSGYTDPVYGGVNDHNFVTPGATALDSYGVVVTPDHTDNVTPDTVGVYTETFSYTDPVTGLTATVARTVNILTSLIPTLTILGTNPYSQDVDLNYTDAGATANDPVTGNVTANIVTTNDLDTTTPGNYSYNYSILGAYGDTVTDVRSITIVSTNSVPVISLVGSDPAYWEVGISPYVDPGATANDTEDGDISSSIVVGGDTVDVNTVGDYNITYNVTDSYGDPAPEVTRVLKVVDKPIVNLLADSGGHTDVVYMELNATPTWANEAVDYLGNVDAVGPAPVVSTLDATVEGDYTETVGYTDHITGISADQKVRTIHVVASLDPTMTLLGDNPQTATENITWIDPGATATDPIDGDVTASIIVINPPDTNTIGSYTVTYSYTNSYNRTVSLDRVVNVVANDPPVITLLGDNPMNVSKQGAMTPVNFNGDNGYTRAGGGKTIDVISDNEIGLRSSGNVVTYPVAVHKMYPAFVGQEHYIDVTFTRDDSGFSYYDQDHTDGALQIGFYFGDTPDNVPDRNPGSWTYGSVTGVVEIDIPPNPPSPLGALSYIWKDASPGSTIGKTVTDVVNDDWPTWTSASVWKIRLTLIDSTHISVKVWVDGVLAKHHDAEITGTGYDPMVNSIKAITFKHHSYNHSSSVETLRNIEIESGLPVAYVEPGATALDDIDGDVTADIVVGGDTVDPYTPGTYNVTYTVTDSYGATSTETRSVVVTDFSYIPNIWLTEDVLGNKSESALLQGQGEIVVEATGMDTSWFNKYLNTHVALPGDFEISMPIRSDACWIVVDPDENKSSWASNPQGYASNCASDAVNLRGSWYTLGIPSGATALDGLIAGIKRVGNTVTTFVRAADGSETTQSDTHTGTLYLHLWQKNATSVNTKGLLINGSPVTDISTWTTSVSTDWNLADTAKTWYDRGAIAMDVEDKDITKDIVVSGDTVDINTVGTYTVTYTVTDSNGFSRAVDRVVSISENTAPEITLLPTAHGETDNVSISVGYPFTDPGYTATDAQDGDITSQVVISGDTVDTSVLGVYNIIHTVHDAVGLETEVTRVVNVIPNQPPVITLNGDDPMVIVVGGTYTDPGATATDPENGDISSSIVVGGDTVDVNTIGDYDVTYDVTDVDGEAAIQQVRRVQIVAAGTIQNQAPTAGDNLTDTTSTPLAQPPTSTVSPNTTSTIDDINPGTTSLTITDAS